MKFTGGNKAKGGGQWKSKGPGGVGGIAKRVRKPKEVKEDFDDEEVGQQPTASHLDVEEGEDGDGNNWKKKKKSGGFQSMGLSHPILKGIMKRGYKVPTPIQRKTIPALLEGKDVVAMARTGSGKTAAFLIPLFEKLQVNKGIQAGQATKFPRALILSPTRELATQTVKFIRELGKYTNLKTVSILGGDSMESQFAALHDKPDVVVATPGRFMHLCVEMEFKLDGVEYIVFDEADRLFEMGFGEQVTEILGRVPETRQTVLFSATLPKILVDFTKAGLHDPTLIRLDVDSKLPDRLTLSYLACRTEDKLATLLYLLRNEIDNRDQTILFVATKHHVEYLHAILDEANISNCYIYSSLDASARKISLGKFRTGVSSVLIVTDIAARGIDIPVLDNVINFHFPAKPKLFMHRVGRVARAGRSGTAYSILSPDEIASLLDLHLFLDRPLKFSDENSKPDSVATVVGRMPQDLLDEEHGFLRNLMDTKSELVSLTKVSKNGYSAYLKSRPSASSESNRRAKGIEVSKLPLHPMFGKFFREDPMSSLITQMQGYRPRTTIFEIGPKAGSETVQMMKMKRDRDQITVTKYRHSKQQTEADGPADTTAMNLKAGNKDEENFISYLPKDHHTESGLSVGTSFEKQVMESVMDLTGDDSQVLKTQRSKLKWDMKRKNFVSNSNEANNRKKIKTESGTWIAASYKSDRYNAWKQKSKVEIQGDDDDDEDGNQGSSGRNNNSMFRRPETNRRGAFGGNNFPKPGGSVPTKRGRFRTEIKKPEQILKDRKVREKKMNKAGKGKGKKGSRNRGSSGKSGGGARKK